jgi:perosamine synthetase
LCPTAEKILETAIRFSVNEFYTEQDMKDVIEAVKKVSNYYSNK